MSTLLITGAAGQLGRFVLDELLASGTVAPSDIIATSRDPSKLADYAEKGVHTRAADFDDAGSLEKAFAGADRILIISTDALDEPGKRLRQHRAAVKAAVDSGARHIVYTSMPNPETSVIPFASDHLGTEQAIKATGLGYTILRNGWYMENLFMSLPHAFAQGAWYTSSGDGKVAYIAKQDIARATAAALAAPEPTNATYTLTGSERYTAQEVASIAAAAIGKPLSVVHLTDEQLANGMKAAGLQPFMIPMLVSFDANTRLGHVEMVTQNAEHLSGRPPTLLSDFIAAHKATLAG